MILAFPTEELRAICESELLAQREFGMTAAEALLGFLADLVAADNLQALPADLVRNATDGEWGAYEMPLPDDYVVRFHVRQYAEHRTEAGKVDRTRVRRVMIHSVARVEVGHG